MKILIFILITFAAGAAYADTYQQITTSNKPRTLVTGPDTFKNRLRYWFLMDDGNPSVYEVVEKNRKGEWVNVVHPDQNPVLIIKGNTLRIEHRDGNKLISMEQFARTTD
ncbi:hypothetical protein GA0061071_102305 [Kosakonia oryzendophytica]|uniref:Nickel/cobalt transporter regulator n=1 Tax=Kosakonia oryzendophytica TaxID=1005665 RepID=A0A1C4A030_9ENTR|nr:hypothetical protein [Kosakonia oryzendophytica]TDT52396.1 hypothetical protein DFO53_3561 [Enterobacter sp. AG5470]WBT57693.1 hypothetical protein O9K67_21585 [Kosakonia oryzendophytica]SCB87933.1 hypothetical protein GA0061071_102305 [Kosakonia oryzendophytica]